MGEMKDMKMGERVWRVYEKMGDEVDEQKQGILLIPIVFVVVIA